jgi:NAD(P)-dependent dehydrogenase (short-subunit alcohol dehydrogenase family)
MHDSGPLPQDLHGRCAVVTGAAHGIGLSIAQHLRRAGANVVAVDKDRQGLKEHFDGVPGFEWIAHDFALADDWYAEDGATTNGDALAKKVLCRAQASALGLPSLIVNNAADGTPHGFLDLEPSDHDSVYRVIVRTPWYLTRRLVQEHLQARTGPPETAPATASAAILFISSIHEHVPARRPHYSASKAAVIQLVRELALELGKHRIRVNAISPGWIRTNPDPTSPEQQAKESALVPRIPLARPGTAEEVARLALVLLSDHVSGYVTGTNLLVDGGLSLDTWVPPPNGSWEAPR